MNSEFVTGKFDLKKSVARVRKEQLERIRKNEAELFWGVKFGTDEEKILLDTLFNGDKREIFKFYKKIESMLDQRGIRTNLREIRIKIEDFNNSDVIKKIFDNRELYLSEGDRIVLSRVVYRLNFEFFRNENIQSVKLEY